MRNVSPELIERLRQILKASQVRRLSIAPRKRAAASAAASPKINAAVRGLPQNGLGRRRPDWQDGHARRPD